MIVLGVGKNMVRAIRFWVQAAGVARTDGDGLKTTEFGDAVLGERGFDPFLEDVRTLWLVHWKLCTPSEAPLFAWDYLLNRWQQPEFTRAGALAGLQIEAARLDNRRLSTVTLEQHFDTFLHTYVPTRSRKGEIQEDSLDCPLVELELIHKVGERRADDQGRTETIYAFRREEKKEISSGLFLFCLHEYWQARHREEATLLFRDIALAAGSPGQIFKLTEVDMRARLERLEQDSDGLYAYRESASFRQVVRTGKTNGDLLASIYRTQA